MARRQGASSRLPDAPHRAARLSCPYMRRVLSRWILSVYIMGIFPLVEGYLVGWWRRAVCRPIDPRLSPFVLNARSRITLYTVAPLGVRSQNPSCTGEGAGAPRGWDLSVQAAFCSHGQERSHIHLGSFGVIAVAPAPVVGFPPSGLEDGAARHHPGLQIAPQRHSQFARQGDDHDPLEAALGVADALVEPLAERTAGLVAQP